jgi:hypothetical protein
VSVQQNLDSFCWPLFPYWEWLHSSIVLLTYLPFAGFDWLSQDMSIEGVGQFIKSLQKLWSTLNY